MKLAHYAVLALTLVAASACEKDVQIVGGKIPAAYLADAKAAVGTYVGGFADTSNSLKVELVGNVVLLTPAHDLLDPRCQSSIGLLTSVSVTQDSNKVVTIRSADFDFDPGLCYEVQGNHIELGFVANGVVEASIFDHWYNNVQCTIVGGPYPTEQCWTNQTPVYDQGEFSKVSN